MLLISQWACSADPEPLWQALNFLSQSASGARSLYIQKFNTIFPSGEFSPIGMPARLIVGGWHGDERYTASCVPDISFPACKLSGGWRASRCQVLGWCRSNLCVSRISVLRRTNIDTKRITFERE